MKESSSPVSKRSSTGSVKGKVNSCYVAAVSITLTQILLLDKNNLSLIYALQTTSAASLSAQESSSSVNKRTSVGSVKGKVKSCFNELCTYFWCACSCYIHTLKKPLFLCFIVDKLSCFFEGHCEYESVISLCQQEFFYWVCERKGKWLLQHYANIKLSAHRKPIDKIAITMHVCMPN